MHKSGILALCMSAIAWGAPLSETEIRAWWAEELRLAQSLELLENCSIEWTKTWDQTPPREELDAMRRRTANKPDHPDRALLEEYEGRLAGQRQDRFDLRMNDAGHWLLRAETGPTGSTTTFAANGTLRWQLTPSSLTLLDESKPFPANSEHLVRPSMIDDAARFVHHGATITLLVLDDPAQLGVRLDEPRRFRLQWSKPAGSPVAATLAATWPENEPAPLVTTIEFVEESESGSARTLLRYDFAYSAQQRIKGRRIADSIRAWDDNPRFGGVLDLRSVVPRVDDPVVTSAELMPPDVSQLRLANPSSRTGADVRVAIRDFRRTDPGTLPHGTTLSIPDNEQIGSRQYRLVQRPEVKQTRTKLRRMGWLVAGGLGSLAVVVLLLQKKQR